MEEYGLLKYFILNKCYFFDNQNCKLLILMISLIFLTYLGLKRINTSLKMEYNQIYARLFEIIGLKNFRIFNDQIGIFENLAAINILTGANNSGKSSMIKFLQMLKNSIDKNQYPYPFNLDLTQQEHLLGDFNNILYNNYNRNIEISLPFRFLGIKDLYISLLFTIPESDDQYHAKLRKIQVIDHSDNEILFSFAYREATDQEIEKSKEEFQIELEEYEKKKKEKNQKKQDIFTSDFLIHPFYDLLVGYIDWTINCKKLKYYLSNLLDFYKVYLKRKNEQGFLKYLDNHYKSTQFVPSELIHSFKSDIKIESWSNFLTNEINNEEIILGKQYIGEGNFDSGEPFSSPLEIEDVFYYNCLEILRKNLSWIGTDSNNKTYPIIKNCFNNSWKALTQRISKIHYLSTIREENARIYDASKNSPFINLLKEYKSNELKYSEFINKYLKAFEIGKNITVKYILKHQLISISITTLENTERDLVDFGYGIKQLILLLIKIDVLAKKNVRTIDEFDSYGDLIFKDIYIPSMLLIEEPETNLHPKWQSLLAQMFAEANKTFNIQFIIETHSEYLIRKFQTLVAQNELDNNDIQIFYLRNPKSNITIEQISSINIQKDGRIDYKLFDSGFFDENDTLELSLLNIQRNQFLKDFNDLKRAKEINQNRILELEQTLDVFTDKLNINIHKQFISQRFNSLKLSHLSIEYLASGQYLLNTINDNDDFAPVVLQYGRTIENELKQVFLNVDNTKMWMLGKMQGSLEKFKNGTTCLQTCNSNEFILLQNELTNNFNNSQNLKIELLDSIRTIRNRAGHSGIIIHKQEAQDYIAEVNMFLDQWTIERR